MFLHCRGLARLGLRGGRLACDEENRAFCSLEQFRRNLTEEKLVAGPRAYAHHQEIVTADLKLTKNGFLRRSDASHRASHLDPIMISQPDNLADDGFGTDCWGECGPDVTLPRASPSLPTGYVERGHCPLRGLCQGDCHLRALPRDGGPSNRYENSELSP